MGFWKPLLRPNYISSFWLVLTVGVLEVGYPAFELFGFGVGFNSWGFGSRNIFIAIKELNRLVLTVGVLEEGSYFTSKDYIKGWF